MDMEVPINSLDTHSSGTTKGKRKASVTDLPDESRTNKARTLGGDLPEASVVVREITARTMGDTSTGRFWSEPHTNILPHPALLTYLCVKVEGSDAMLEARNSENDGMSYCSTLTLVLTTDSGQPEARFSDAKGVQFIDYLPSPVLALTATSSFCAVALLGGSVVVYSHTGRR
jgi:protein HIRA/HIR1